MVSLQREVLRLFLNALDEKDGTVAIGYDGAVKDFLLKSIRHHISQSRQQGIPLHKDELMMRLFTDERAVILQRAAAGIGLEDLHKDIARCEGESYWREASHLWFAISTLHAQTSGEQLKRARQALSHVQPETLQSRVFENRILSQLLYNENGYAPGSAEKAELCQRIVKLSELLQQEASVSDALKFELLFSVGLIHAVSVTPHTVREKKRMRGVRGEESGGRGWSQWWGRESKGSEEKKVVVAVVGHNGVATMVGKA